jgi:predicted PurR-regulated permease PerM
VAGSNSTPSLRPIIVLAGLVLVVGFLYWARSVLVPLALAGLVAFILTPAVNALQRRGPGRVTSVVIVVLLAFGLLSGIVVYVGDQLAGLVRRLPDYREVIVAKVRTLSDSEGTGLLSTVRKTVHDVDERMQQSTRDPGGPAPGEHSEDETRGHSPDKPVYVQQTATGWNGLAEYAGPVAEGLASTVLVAVLVIFMLIQRENLRNRLVRLVGHGELILTTRAINEGARRISRFLVMQLCVNAGFGVTLSMALAVLSFFGRTPGDVDTLRRYAILWGFVCGLLRFVPYVGTWVGAALLFGFTIATLHGWTLPLTIFAVFIVLEIVSANVIEPLLFGHSTGSSPLALLLAAAFWAWLWGPIGLLLSTPLTVVLVVIGKYVPQLQFLETLLGDEPVLLPSVVFYQRLVAKDRDEATDLLEDYADRHSPEGAYEEVVRPALALARRDLERGHLRGKHDRELLRTMHELIDEIAPADGELPAAGPPPARVLGYPARDQVDELAVQMLAHLLRAGGRSLEVISSAALTAEVLEKAADTGPAVVVVVSVAPGGLAQTRYLCKRLKAQAPSIKVVVCRLDQDEDLDRERERLKSAGADCVSVNLSETRVEVISLLQVAEALAQRLPDSAGELSMSL